MRIGLHENGEHIFVHVNNLAEGQTKVIVFNPKTIKIIDAKMIYDADA